MRFKRIISIVCMIMLLITSIGNIQVYANIDKYNRNCLLLNDPEVEARFSNYTTWADIRLVTSQH